MVGKGQYKNFDQLSIADMLVYQSIPPHPFWDRANEVIDFSFADKICEPLYSPMGQRPYAPSLKLRIHLVQRYYDISDREMELKIIGDIFVKRFLGLPITHSKFDHSTIGLDRDRLGSEMFHAYHVFILAQALEKELWGQDDDRWLADTFHTNARVSTPGSYEMIQQAAKLIIRHLEKKNPQQHAYLAAKVDLTEFSRKLKNTMSKKKRSLAYSKLIVLSYGLVAWMTRLSQDNQSPWNSEDERQKSEAHCEVLLRILRENTTEAPHDDPGPDNKTQEKESPNGSVNESIDTEDEQLKYVELSKNEKPTDRIVNVFDPELRVGSKSVHQRFIGDKVQVVESWKHKLVLLAEPIVGNEPDGKALFSLVQSIIEEFQKTPSEVLADKGYSWGSNHEKFHSKNLRLTTPFPKSVNPAGKIPNREFKYSPEEKKVTCPAGHTTSSYSYIKASEGTQYKFPKETCDACPLKEQCTSSTEKSIFGRTVFFSDYWELLQRVQAYLITPQGQQALMERYEIERTNNELKRHHGLREPRTRGRHKLRITVKLTGIVVNLKRMVKALSTDPPAKNKAPVCA